jgi:hypothetical protein
MGSWVAKVNAVAGEATAAMVMSDIVGGFSAGTVTPRAVTVVMVATVGVAATVAAVGMVEMPARSASEC